MAAERDGAIYLGTSRHPDDSLNEAEHLLLRYANRHGLITGATGTGKTVSLQILAEGFSLAGVPVFLSDVKGDIAGLGKRGTPNEALATRARTIGLDDYGPAEFPTIFWDLFGEQGHPIRATVTEMGPLLLSRMMELNDTQEGVLNIAFRLADDEGLLLLDLKDLRALLSYVAEHAKEIGRDYGLVSTQSVSAIQRSLLVLENQGGENFFGEPALKIEDLMRRTPDGRGAINVLAADRLMRSPRLYSTFLLWLLSELFEELPEVGDPDKPKLVFFFDEAHLLFDEAPSALIQRIEQVVKLIRSKGVGVYFVTQNPLDVPDSVLAQLGNRIQHALRAYTPREAKAVRTAADTFRANPEFDTGEAITKLGVGEALVSTLRDKGVPSVVQRTLIRPPSSRLGPITPEERQELMGYSPVGATYDQAVDRESAYEVLTGRAGGSMRAEETQAEAERSASPWGPSGGRTTSRQPDREERRATPQRGERDERDEREADSGRTGGFRLPDLRDFGLPWGEDTREQPRYRDDDRYRDDRDARYRRGDDDDDDDDDDRRRPRLRYREDAREREREKERARPRGYQRQTVTEAAIKSVTRTVASSLGRALVRGVLGSLKRGR